jgi:hypothetical protein
MPARLISFPSTLNGAIRPAPSIPSQSWTMWSSAPVHAIRCFTSFAASFTSC